MAYEMVRVWNDWVRCRKGTEWLDYGMFRYYLCARHGQIWARKFQEQQLSRIPIENYQNILLSNIFRMMQK